jgi:hypothetical protein
MKGNFHVRFLGEEATATSLPYPTHRSKLRRLTAHWSGTLTMFAPLSVRRYVDMESQSAV